MIKLTAVDYEYVAQFASAAAREHVSVQPTKTATHWFTDSERPIQRHGFAGLLLVAGSKWRIKGVYIFPEWRGFGHGEAMTLALIGKAIQWGAKELEAIALNPAFYERHGWERVKEVRPGSWRVRVKI